MRKILAMFMCALLIVSNSGMTTYAMAMSQEESREVLSVLEAEQKDLEILVGSPSENYVEYTYVTDGTRYKVVENKVAEKEVYSEIYKENTDGTFSIYSTQSFRIYSSGTDIIAELIIYRNEQVVSIDRQIIGTVETSTTPVPFATFWGEPVTDWIEDDFYTYSNTKITKYTLTAIVILLSSLVQYSVPESSPVVGVFEYIATVIIDENIPEIYQKTLCSEKRVVGYPNIIAAMKYEDWWYTDENYSDEIEYTVECVYNNGYEE